MKLTPSELDALEALTKQLQSSPGDSRPQNDQLSAVLKIATKWAPAERIPGLDILRLCAVAPAFAQHTSDANGTIVDLLTRAGVFAADTDKPNNTMLAVRVLANMFVCGEGRLVADGCFEEIVSSVKPFTNYVSNKGLSTAIATLYINYAVMLTSGAPSTESRSREQRAEAIVDGATRLLQPNRDSETVYRALVATGTLLSLGNEFRTSVWGTKNLPKLLGELESSGLNKESRIGVLIKEIKDQMK